ncbi:hypothetical protein KIV45_18950 [Janthinobacterium lividum]|nr:hypothetical protein KIV45_18950 [Janthinobacterium lividum]
MNFCPVPMDEARQIVARMVGVAKWDWSSALCGADDFINGGTMYAALDPDGTPIVVVVVEQVQQEHGRELVIRVAHQLVRGRDLVGEVLPEIERVFGAGCDAVVIYTKRAGLVRKLQGAGYGEAAKIMRKKIMNIREFRHKVLYGPICRIGGDKKQTTQTSSAVTDSRSIVTNTLDGGAIAGALDMGKAAITGSTANTGKALDYGDSLFTTASGAVAKTADSAMTRYADLFDQSMTAVTSGAKDSQKTYENLFDKSLGFVENSQKNLTTAYDKAQSAQSAAMGQLQGAYADAKGTSDSQKQVIIGVLVVAGLLVMAPVLAKA